MYPYVHFQCFRFRFKSILTMNPIIPRRIAEKSFLFFDCYFNLLIKIGQTMEPRYYNTCHYTWQYAFVSNISNMFVNVWIVYCL